MADLFVDENAVPLDPLINLLQLRHTVGSNFTSSEEKAAAKEAILKESLEHNMRPYYQFICNLFGWPIDESAVAKMDDINNKVVEKYDAQLKEAQESMGNIEIREALWKKCEHYARIGDLENCLKTNEECLKYTLAGGPKMDLMFQRIRLGIAFGNNEIAAKGVQDATKMVKDADWERRNRLKVYEGLYLVFIRDFKRGSKLLSDSLSTFATSELLDFKQFVFIAVVTSLPHLSRPELKKNVVDSPEVVSVNNSSLNELVSAIYNCRYKNVFPALEQVCQDMRKNVFLTAHVNYVFREIRVMVFNQFLDSYSSVTLKSMSTAFRIPLSVLDSMLSTFINNERISCKIDRVNGSVVTFRGDATNFQYHKLLKNSDLLLNRIQKLSRSVEMQ